ncbi:DUF3072 domain-containing protein [Roseomonas nepalensis]|uniref:DUF3072 domain-containing protein n=1 Tax=Muricoccus nepalensis TaxID=1854500 RepID=A0A502G4T8_9PROT|nr:DUF3072 domain-containing protein [Roseomonas nepalensis]TPG56859.1 DUF3072 domain-containing protein [Roseomonas nepalensis]
MTKPAAKSHDAHASGKSDAKSGAGAHAEDHNPKTDPEPGSNTIKDPSDWTTGDQPMTGAQASYLKTLSEEAGEGFEEGLSKAEASRRIDALQDKTGRGT